MVKCPKCKTEFKIIKINIGFHPISLMVGLFVLPFVVIGYGLVGAYRCIRQAFFSDEQMRKYEIFGAYNEFAYIIGPNKKW